MAKQFSRRSVLRGTGSLAIAAPMAGWLTGCAGENTGEGSGQSLKVAIGNEPPYTKLQPDGTVTGAEPDVLQAVLTRMGYGQIKGEVVDYEAMIPGLQAGRWDVIAAGLFMKQSRCAEVSYAEPVIVSTESYAVPSGNPDGITTVADVKSKPDLMVAAINGAFEEGILTTGGVPKDQILPVKDGISGIEALKAGRCAAFILPTLSLEAIAENTGDFDITDVIPDAPKTGSSAAFKKDEKDLFNTYNEELTKFKETQEFQDILDKWGFDPEAAQGVTAEELCQNPG